MQLPFKHLPAGNGHVYRVIGGDEIACKLLGRETGGEFSIFETTTPPNCGPPKHVHHREDELFYVLDGELEFTIGDEQVRAAAGSFLAAPRDVPHCFQNVGSVPAKMLVIVRPAGLEDFFEEFSRLPADEPPDFAKMAAVAGKFGLEFVP